MADGTPGRARGEARVAVVGVSDSETCGVRDHATLLADAIEDRGVSCAWRWLTRRDHSFGGARSEFGAWAGALGEELGDAPFDAVILHYSVFSFSFKGIPVFVPATMRALRGSRLPVVSILHEFAYPLGPGGLRGRSWALSQRAVLPSVIGGSAAALVNVPSRAEWLATRRWLPSRPIAFAPVFSNLPPPAAQRPPVAVEGQQIGLFGYAYEGAASTLVLDALHLLRARGLRVSLRLLGAPGRESPAGQAWLTAARSRGIEELLSFSGVLSGQQLSDALAACTVLLHPEPTGPTSRKGTLAASLASGSAVVAIDGPGRWQELVDADALLLVDPSAEPLADGVAALLEDPSRRAALGASGRGFAASNMGVQRTVETVASILREALGPGGQALPLALGSPG